MDCSRGVLLPFFPVFCSGVACLEAWVGDWLELLPEDWLELLPGDWLELLPGEWLELLPGDWLELFPEFTVRGCPSSVPFAWCCIVYILSKHNYLKYY